MKFCFKFKSQFCAVVVLQFCFRMYPVNDNPLKNDQVCTDGKYEFFASLHMLLKNILILILDLAFLSAPLPSFQDQL